MVARRITRLLERRGMTATSEESGATDLWADDAPTLAGLAEASVQGVIALGPRAGARVARSGSPPEEEYGLSSELAPRIMHDVLIAHQQETGMLVFPASCLYDHPRKRPYLPGETVRPRTAQSDRSHRRSRTCGGNYTMTAPQLPDRAPGR